jgi:hypothetical protein
MASASDWLMSYARTQRYDSKDSATGVLQAN